MTAPEMPGGELVPENVGEGEAEVYLYAAGWVNMGEGVGWSHALHPLRTKDGQLVGKPRGRAVVLQYQADWSRLMFVLGRGKPTHVKMLLGRTMAMCWMDLAEAQAQVDAAAKEAK